MSTTKSPLDEHREKIEELIAKGYGNALITWLLKSEVKTTESSLRRALKRWGIERPKRATDLKIEGDEGEVTSQPSTTPTDPELVMMEHGLDPEDWQVHGVIINGWDSPTGDRLRQLKVQLKRAKPIELVYPARTEGYKPLKIKLPKKQGAKTVVFVGDQQAPYHHVGLHKAFCQFLTDVQPDEGVLIGDTMDFPVISRHPAEPVWAATSQECLDAAYFLLCDYVQASEGTSWKKLAGNHDERLRRSIIDRVPDLHQLCRAPSNTGTISIFSPAFLLRLDELGIDYIDPAGGYNAAQLQVSPHLAARHGWIARKGSGASALATLEHLGYSVIVGHTHRQSLVHKTRHDIQGELSTLAAVETGCMCRIEEGLGYTVAPDWQNGFATASVWPDGSFKIDLATFVNGVLYWRDKRYG